MPPARRRTATVVDARLPVGSPLWWVKRLHAQLVERQKDIELFDDYYSGNHPLPWLAPQAVEEFRRILRMTRTNYMGLVVDAMVERMSVEGFRLGAPSVPPRLPPPPDPAVDTLAQLAEEPPDLASGEPDLETWRIWQANNMDSDYDQGLLEAAICGMSYLLVAPNLDDPRTPHIWVEHAGQAIVEHEPGTNRRKAGAGLKVWRDDWTQDYLATLYLPDALYKFRATASSARSQSQLDWQPRRVAGEPWPLPNPAGEVTLYEMPNNPRLLTGGVSELADVIDVQDRINKTVADRLMTQDYGAFPAKWASGWPMTDETGNPTPTIDIGRDRMTTTDVPEAKFGQWDAAPLDPYSLAKREDVKDVASRTRTPAQYLLGELNNVNGETLKASESGLVSKARQRCRSHSDPLERAMRTVRRLAGLPSQGGESMEIIWRNPEFRTEGELVDALQKMATLGVPREALWERWGATPTEIARWRIMQREEQRRNDMQAILAERYRLAAVRGDAIAAQRQGGAPPPAAGGGASAFGRSALAADIDIDADKDGIVNEDG